MFEQVFVVGSESKCVFVCESESERGEKCLARGWIAAKKSPPFMSLKKKQRGM